MTKVQGLTIDLSADASGLKSALTQVNSATSATNKNLKEINNLLKFDPKNVELLNQKQKQLKDQIENTTSKLKVLKQQEESLKATGAVEGTEQYDKLKRQIIATENQLKSYQSQLQKTNSQMDDSKTSKLAKSFENLGSKLKDLGKNAASIGWDALKKGVAGVAGALTAITTASVNAYSDLEQSMGGVKTLFKDSSDKVVQNAENAYKTAGLSASEYMETVTSFSASLLQSLGNDTEKAAEVADMALTDMSDNSKSFGTDMSSIQSAYQGFAKQNYTMLDNLKLGYGGTKTEMERLLSDAEKFSGVHYDINNLSDVYNAIHVIQENLDVSGTAAEKASKTIGGSASSMKAAFTNFLSGAGSPEALVDSIETFGENLGNVIVEMLPSLVDGIEKLVNSLLEDLPSILETILPILVDSVFSILSSLIQSITDYLPTFIQQLLKMLPDMISQLIELVIQIMDALTEMIPELLPEIVAAIMDLLPMLYEYTPQFLEAGFDLIVAIGEGLIKSIPEIVKRIPEVITAMVNAFNKIKDKIKSVGTNLIKGLWEGIKDKVQWLKDKISGWVGDVLSFIKKLFGIASPSKETKKDGKFIAAGLANGILEGLPMVENAVSQMSNAVNGSLTSDINVNGNGTKGNVVNLTFNAQTLDDGQINKVINAVNTALGNSY